MRTRLVFFCLINFLAVTSLNADHYKYDWAFEINAGWQSEYVTEGRNNLEEGGLITYQLATEISGLDVGYWYAYADSEIYEEWNFMVEYNFDFAGFEPYIGYNRVEIIEIDSNDNEYWAGLSYGNIPYLTPGIDYVYSSGTKGGYFEIYLKSKFDFFEEQVVLEPYILEGFDYGYETEEHDGPNHFQLGVDLSWTLTQYVDLTAFFAHSFALEDIEREGLSDQTWGGIGFSFRLE